jgi:hypothetical protein
MIDLDNYIPIHIRMREYILTNTVGILKRGNYLSINTELIQFIVGKNEEGVEGAHRWSADLDPLRIHAFGRCAMGVCRYLDWHKGSGLVWSAGIVADSQIRHSENPVQHYSRNAKNMQFYLSGVFGHALQYNYKQINLYKKRGDC